MILFKLRKGDPSDSQADATASLTGDDDLPKLTHSSPTLYDSLRYDSTPLRVKPIAFGSYCTKGTGVLTQINVQLSTIDELFCMEVIHNFKQIK